MVPPIIAITEALRNEHLRQVDAVVKRLIDAYGMLYRKLGAQQVALLAELETLAETGAGRRAYLRRIEALLRQIEAEVGRYAIYADQEIQRAAREAIDLGLKHAAREVQLSFPQWAQARIMGAFNRLPVDAIEAMLGFLGDTSPLHTSLVDQFGREVAKRIGDKLVEGIALGYNPRKVAYDLVREGLGEGLTWSMRTARTAQLWAYREAQRASDVANSHIVQGWVWVAVKDDRVCMSCLAMDGTEHRPEEVLNDHHNGRCARVVKTPALPGAAPMQYQNGQEWFTALPEARQRGLMGDAMYDAWRAGKFDFKDLSVPYQDKVYGEMLRAASLKELLGDQAKEYYRKAV
jgi:hypothetical protein